MAYSSSHFRKNSTRHGRRPGTILLAAISLLLPLRANRNSAADSNPTPASPHDLGFRIAPGNSPPATPEDGLIKPGEELNLSVEEDSSFNGIYQVRRGGYIIMPQVGRIAVGGKSLAEAEAAVTRALQAAQLPHATVIIVRHNAADVKNAPIIYLTGEFREPSTWRIPSGITPTLVNVILSSGGVSDKADLTRVRVIRIAANKGVVQEVNVAKILEGRSLTYDVTLGAGDVIFIPAGVPPRRVPPHDPYLKEILDKFKPTAGP